MFLCRFHEKKEHYLYIYFFADGGFWCLFKNTVKLDLYVFPSDIAEGHSGRFWHTSWIYWTNLGCLGSESSQSQRKFWEIWRRIRVTTDWHNTVGLPPSWQLPLDTCVNSKFDNNHHTYIFFLNVFFTKIWGKTPDYMASSLNNFAMVWLLAPFSTESIMFKSISPKFFPWSNYQTGKKVY